MVVAEGAGQRLMADDAGFRGDREGAGKDASGNLKLLDVGLWLSDKLKVRSACPVRPVVHLVERMDAGMGGAEPTQWIAVHCRAMDTTVNVYQWREQGSFEVECFILLVQMSVSPQLMAASLLVPVPQRNVLACAEAFLCQAKGHPAQVHW